MSDKNTTAFSSAAGNPKAPAPFPSGGAKLS